jgi:hypothetical protein
VVLLLGRGREVCSGCERDGMDTDYNLCFGDTRRFCRMGFVEGKVGNECFVWIGIQNSAIVWYGYKGMPYSGRGKTCSCRFMTN